MDTPAAEQQSRRLKYTGRIFRLKFETTPRGVPKLTMGIAEHPNPEEPDETTWHKKVVATRELASSLNALDPPLHKGEQVEVENAYPYKWPYTGKGGEEKFNEGETLWIIKVRGAKYSAKRRKQPPDQNQGT